MNRNLVSKSNPVVLEGLANDLHQQIGELAGFFSRLFVDHRNTQLGKKICEITQSIFELWCTKSYVIPLAKAEKEIRQLLAESSTSYDSLNHFLQTDLNFATEQAAQASDSILSLARANKLTDEELEKILWSLYTAAIQKFSVQTAHVFVARLLLYRVGEDKDAFPVKISGKELEEDFTQPGTPGGVSQPTLSLINQVRLDMEDFLPAIYKMGEFDWWYVPDDKRALLDEGEKAHLYQCHKELEVVSKRLLSSLDRYEFSEIDVDVWKNVYQHYLPREERQKLGGFYTPDELVELILDVADYQPHHECLCQKSFLDPASGSGTFIVEALSRLLKHLELDLPCHQELRTRNQAAWKRAEHVLRIVESNLHAIDLHPFAAFLTTLNVTFMLLDAYVMVKKKSPLFVVDLHIFSADSLEKPDEEVIHRELFNRLNARVQLSEDSFKRYKELLGKRFHFVFGNPPWGGILKGPLSPIFDEAQKARFKQEYPDSATGKYDIYGLFIDRSLSILSEGGRFGFITQNTYMDKEWASRLRTKLAQRASVREIIDIGPFGQLFFHALNTPCITIVDNVSPDLKGDVHILLAEPVKDWKGLDEAQRRKAVVETIRSVRRKVKGSGSTVKQDFARAFSLSRKRLHDMNGSPWILSPTKKRIRKFAKDAVVLTDLVEPRQGVTPGGALDVFLIDEATVKNLRLEKALVHKAFKSLEIERWHVQWTGRYLLYPYIVRESSSDPAFKVSRPDIADALDFEVTLDSEEKSYLRGHVLDHETATKILEHRIAKGLVKFPNAARYLVNHYNSLESRVFEKRRFTSGGKRWYEYHRPRDPQLMLSKTRIVSPSLVKPEELRFALDNSGLLSDHACEYLLITAKTRRRFGEFRTTLSKMSRRKSKLTAKDVLLYLLAFLNSYYAQELLVAGRRPSPKGFYPINEAYLASIKIPLPMSAKWMSEVLTLVAKASRNTSTSQQESVGKTINALIKKAIH